MGMTTANVSTTAHQRHYDLLIFDWDGTLMDSTSLIAGCIQAACVAIGQPRPPLELAKHVIGLGLRDALELCAPHCPPEKYSELATHYRNNFLSQDSQLCFFEGVEAMLATLKAQGYRLAVATGKNRAGLDRVLNTTAAGHYFEITRTADETRSKPHPAMLHEILAATNVPVSRALMLGDTTHDIDMATAAGMDSFAVTQGAHDRAKLAASKPTALCEHLVELSAWLEAKRV